MPKDERPTVYTTELGDLRKPKSQTLPTRSLPPQQQNAYLHRDSKGRGGKIVTVVKNLVLKENDLKDLSKKLKQACGSGGTIKDGTIEIQGDHREKISSVLQALGYHVKIAGG